MDINNNNVEGIELVVTVKESGGGGWLNASGQEMKIVEDEWYPAILKNLSPYTNQWGNQLRWVFELQGKDFTWQDSEGNKGQLRVSLQTSLICSPRSKLYKVYSKLTGREPKEGDKIDLKKLIGIPVYVMVKANKGKNKEGEVRTYYNVEKVKLRKEEGSLKTPQPSISESQPQQPQQQTQPQQKTWEEEHKELLEKDKSTNQSKESDIFEDIF